MREGRLLFSGGIWPSSEPPGRVLLVGGTYWYTKLSDVLDIQAQHVIQHQKAGKKICDFGGRPAYAYSCRDTPQCTLQVALQSQLSSILTMGEHPDFRWWAGRSMSLFCKQHSQPTSSQLVLRRWNAERWKGWTSNRRRCLFFFLWGEIFNLKHTFYRAFSRSNMSSNSIQHLRSNLCTVPTFGVEITAMAMNSFGATCSNRRVIWLVAGLQGCSFAFAWPWTALTPVAAWSSIEELEE